MSVPKKPRTALKGLHRLPVYEKGNVLSFKLNPNEFDHELFDGPRLDAKILGFFGPFTMSPVVKVRVQTKKGLLHAVLKTYDRRYLKIIRDDDADMLADFHSENGTLAPPNDVVKHRDTRDSNTTPESSAEEDAAWEECVTKGRASDILARLDHSDFPPEEMSPAIREAKYQNTAMEDWKNEVAAYRALHSLQGLSIPKSYANASWRPENDCGEFFEIGCILVEHIDGISLECSLNDSTDHLDEEELEADRSEYKAWAQAFQESIYRQFRVYDADRNLGNVIVERKTSRLVHIDFACNLAL